MQPISSRMHLRYGKCRNLKVPIMIHTGAGVLLQIQLVVNALEEFQMGVLAHAGSEMHNQQATYLARKFDMSF